MEWPGIIKAVFVKLPVALHAEVKAQAARQHRTIEAAYQEALEDWLGVGTQSAEGTPVKEQRKNLSIAGFRVEPENIELHKQLERILRRGTKGTQKALLGALALAEEIPGEFGETEALQDTVVIPHADQQERNRDSGGGQGRDSGNGGGISKESSPPAKQGGGGRSD